MKNGDLVTFKHHSKPTYRIEQLDEKGVCRLRIIEPTNEGFAQGTYTEESILEFGTIQEVNIDWIKEIGE